MVTKETQNNFVLTNLPFILFIVGMQLNVNCSELVVAIAEILLDGQVIFNYVMAWTLFERSARCESFPAALAGLTGRYGF
jgi:hypothetical protein